MIEFSKSVQAILSGPYNAIITFMNIIMMAVRIFCSKASKLEIEVETEKPKIWWVLETLSGHGSLYL